MGEGREGRPSQPMPPHWPSGQVLAVGVHHASALGAPHRPGPSLLHVAAPLSPQAVTLLLRRWQCAHLGVTRKTAAHSRPRAHRSVSPGRPSWHLVRPKTKGRGGWVMRRPRRCRTFHREQVRVPPPNSKVTPGSAPQIPGVALSPKYPPSPGYGHSAVSQPWDAPDTS